MKKRLLAISLSANLLLLALCGWLWFAPATSFPIAVPDCIPDFSYAGQLRLPSNTVFLPDDDEIYDQIYSVRFQFLVRVHGTGEYEGFDQLRVKRTFLRPTEHFNNFYLLRFCPEDGHWWLLYGPDHAERTYSSIHTGEDECEYWVPSGLIAEPGRYMLTFPEQYGRGCIGLCEFELN